MYQGKVYGLQTGRKCWRERTTSEPAQPSPQQYKYCSVGGLGGHISTGYLYVPTFPPHLDLKPSPPHTPIHPRTPHLLPSIPTPPTHPCPSHTLPVNIIPTSEVRMSGLWVESQLAGHCHSSNHTLTLPSSTDKLTHTLTGSEAVCDV